MTDAAYFNRGDVERFELFLPKPTGDSDILKDLGFVPGLKEILMLRQVHALEHATVWILSDPNLNPEFRSTNLESWQQDNENLGGFSTDKGFYLYGQVNLRQLNRAAYLALERLKAGEWNLAVHPRCGTNLSVSMLLSAGLFLGAHLLLPRGPIEQTIGLGLAVTAAAHLAPELGISAQKYLTTAIPFNLTILNISLTQDLWGRPAHFVRVQWQDLQ